MTRGGCNSLPAKNATRGRLRLGSAKAPVSRSESGCLCRTERPSELARSRAQGFICPNPFRGRPCRKGIGGRQPSVFSWEGTTQRPQGHSVTLCSSTKLNVYRGGRKDGRQEDTDRIVNYGGDPLSVKSIQLHDRSRGSAPESSPTSSP